MVRDARVILSREIRHAILKITPGNHEKDIAAEVVEKEVAPAMASPGSPPPAGDHLPSDATAADLHQRHVDAEQHEHERGHADVARVERVSAPDQPQLPL